jgi:hypothetical protein
MSFIGPLRDDEIVFFSFLAVMVVMKKFKKDPTRYIPAKQ